METVFTFDADVVSDLHKDAYGFRPRGDFWKNWDAATDEQRQAEWDHLLEAVERSVAQEKAEQADAIVRFEKLVDMTISSGAADRETALRWIMDASRCDGDWEFLSYNHGLPYGYFKA